MQSDRISKQKAVRFPVCLTNRELFFFVDIKQDHTGTDNDCKEGKNVPCRSVSLYLLAARLKQRRIFSKTGCLYP